MGKLNIACLVLTLFFGMGAFCAMANDGYSFGREVSLDNEKCGIDHFSSKPKINAYYAVPNRNPAKKDRIVKLPVKVTAFKNRYKPEITVIQLKASVSLVNAKLRKTLGKSALLNEMLDSDIQVDKHMVSIDFTQGKRHGDKNVASFTMTPPKIYTDSLFRILGDNGESYILARVKNFGKRPSAWLEWRETLKSSKIAIQRVTLKNVTEQYHRLPENVRRMIGVDFPLGNTGDGYYVFKIPKKQQAQSELTFAIDNANGLDAVILPDA